MNPSFYDPANATRWAYSPNARVLQEVAREYARQYGIKNAVTDRRRVLLLAIDNQRDFSFPEGTLYVGGRSGTGAMDDQRRLVEFVYREMGNITSFVPTMDTHQAFQIFTPSFWLDQDGQNLQPHDMIDGDLQVIRGGSPTGQKARLNAAIARELVGSDNLPWLQKYVAHYVAELARKGYYMLYIWPEHCVLGSDGHVLSGVVQEARMFHAYVRNSQNQPQVKGGNPFAENYSVFSPEVLTDHEGKARLEKNTGFINLLLQFDAVVVAGQASSHCVMSSIRDLLGAISMKDPSLAKKVYILRDCTSAVVVPGVVDYTDAAQKAFDEFADAGMNLVLSTDPMDSWLKV